METLEYCDNTGAFLLWFVLSQSVFLVKEESIYKTDNKKFKFLKFSLLQRTLCFLTGRFYWIHHRLLDNSTEASKALTETLPSSLVLSHYLSFSSSFT